MLSKTIIKYIQSLAHKKFRDEYGEFIAEGPKVVAELLQSNKFTCIYIFGLQSWMNENVELIKDNSAKEKKEITEAELEKISLLQTPNKVVAVFSKKPAEEVDYESNFSLMLDEIQDPGNMGTIIRTADWFGVKNIICSLDCSDCYNPKVVQASMGSISRINIFYTDLINFLKQKDIYVYAATLGGKNVYEFEKIKKGILLIGNESKGINQNLLSMATVEIAIPKIGKAESLNAAVACGIILGHLI